MRRWEPRHHESQRPTLPDIPLPPGIRSRFVEDINGLRMHVLEAGFETQRPALPAAAARLSRTGLQLAQGDAGAGGGRLSRDRAGPARLRPHHRLGSDYDGDLGSFRLLNLVRDALGLVSAFGYASVDAVVGHDFGSSVAAWCALVRPDVFRSVALMSAPFAGPPAAAVQHR